MFSRKPIRRTLLVSRAAPNVKAGKLLALTTTGPVHSADGKTKLEEAGFRVTGTSRDEFAKIIAADTVKWGKAVAATGFKAD